MREAQVRSLMRELRSHMPYGVSKNKESKTMFFWVFLAHPVVNSFTLVNGYVDNSVTHVEKCLEMQVKKKDVPMSVTWGKKEKKKHLLFYQLSDIPSHHLLLLSSSPFFCAMHLCHGSWSPNHWTARERPWLRRNTLNVYNSLPFP